MTNPLKKPAHKPMSVLPNPFAAPPRPLAELAKVAPSEPRYSLQRSGPDLDPTEVETTEEAIELVLMWGEEVLHVAHLSPGRGFAIGETDERQVDYLLSADLLGASYLQVIEGGALLVPAGAEIEGAEIGEARRLPLTRDAQIIMHHRGFTFRVRAVAAGKRIGAGGPRPSLRSYGWATLSLAIHGLFLTMFYFLPPSASAIGIGDLGMEHRLIQYATEPQEVIEEDPLDDPEEADEGTEGQAHVGDEGRMGDQEAEPSRGHYEARRRREGPAQLSRESQREMAANLNTIGALRSAMSSWAAPTSPYGSTSPNGTGEADVMGALMGDFTGSAFGIGGLGLNGTGRGGCVAGGPCGEGTIGVGRLGTIGSDGHGHGDYGRAVHLRNRRDSRTPPRIGESGVASLHGALSRDVIRRVVRRHLAEVRYCYEQGLHQNPSLEGRVAISFIISGTGSVQSAAVASNTLGNAQVGSCISQAVQRWTFPQPENGSLVGVTYPFALQSND